MHLIQYVLHAYPSYKMAQKSPRSPKILAEESFKKLYENTNLSRATCKTDENRKLCIEHEGLSLKKFCKLDTFLSVN
jgi:hypothetical protein